MNSSIDRSINRSINQSVNQLITYALTHSLTRSPAHSLTHSLTRHRLPRGRQSHSSGRCLHNRYSARTGSICGSLQLGGDAQGSWQLQRCAGLLRGSSGQRSSSPEPRHTITSGCRPPDYPTKLPTTRLNYHTTELRKHAKQ